MSKSLKDMEMAWEEGVTEGAQTLYRVVSWSGFGGRRLRRTNYYVSEEKCTEAVERIDPEDLIGVYEYRIVNPKGEPA